jgi:hypothetical protein
MGKKCVPGVFCIENMTLFVLVVILVVLVYLVYVYAIKPGQTVYVTTSVPTQVLEHGIRFSGPAIGGPLGTIATRNERGDNIFENPYSPPYKTDGTYFPSDGGDIRGLPIGGLPVNMRTRGYGAQFNQVGILTRSKTDDALILPLMGRITMTGRSKWQYYAISNTGAVNTRLPVQVQGKNCTGEYGCDEIVSGDTVLVEGYGDMFRATIYETSGLAYIPYHLSV